MKPALFSSGLMICDQVIIEERSRNASIINSFAARRVASVPTVLNPFYFYAVLSDGLGNYQMEFMLAHLESGKEVRSLSIQQTFPDPLHTVRLCLKVENCRIASFGSYLVTLLADGMWVAQRGFQILPKESVA